MSLFAPAEIFKAYDIRGIVQSALTPEAVHNIGRAIGSEAIELKQSTVAIGRDGRGSGPELSNALSEGLRASGANVIDVGMVATPMLYYATHALNTHSGVMVTGSHNPPEYNGLKMVLAGETLAGPRIQQLRERILKGQLTQGQGTYQTHDIAEAYLQRILGDVKLARPMKIAVDCGNGIAGPTAPLLYQRMGCVVEPLFCDVDSRFPNHHPDPSQPKNLQDLIQALSKGSSEIGLAFDGDGDRLGVVTKQGNIIFPDRQLMLFAAEVLSRNPGSDIIFDVKSTRNLFDWVRSHGGRPLLWKTGHSFIKAKLKETGAPLAGEMSGHMFFKDRWYGFDDALYAGARLLEILSKVNNVSSALDSLPDAVNTPELHIQTQEGENYRLMDILKTQAHFEGSIETIDIDGIRVEYEDGFGLARPSNTTPVIVLRFEAQSEKSLQRIQAAFKQAFLNIKPDLQLPF
jgi:phosphomannomutase/phosphoglucomutase